MDAAEQPTYVTRRDFLGSACSAAALIALGVPFAACSSSSTSARPASAAGQAAAMSGIAVTGNTITLDLGMTDTSSLTTSGGFLFIEDANTVVVNANGTIRAFTSVCPHAGCDVDRREGDQLVCPCHGSRFGTDGSLQRGPARSGLREYPVTHVERIVTIQKA
ncbi:MAG TPA: Rieske (2Fe-2S) protein [Rhodothermales bacterium]|nr:Rieske (2Fe-2S) protein [Rhodothermales bacterium]